MLSMSKPALSLTIWSLLLIALNGCGGPDEGIYTGVIGSKKNIRLFVDSDGIIELEGYWRENLIGRHEKGSLKGKNMDALVFEGPKEKNFKLRFLYEEEGREMVIRAIQSRTYGPGSRYVPTENDSVFDPPPRLSLLGKSNN
jgi:hypothetical protein